MDMPEKFVELAHAEGNEINLQTKALENIFENPEVRDTQIAIYSVLGKPSSKTSQHFQDALKYLFQKDGIDLDDTLTKTILEFGNPTESQKASIVTWSKPFFVTKGSKQVAIFLLGIQGSFKDSYDPAYIMLSGLCSFMSSTIIYLADGKTEEFLKHIGCIAVEGLRHLSKQTSLLHQKMVVVVENWSRTEEVTFGNASSQTYLDHLKTNLKKGLNKTFEAFEEFGFFFLPSSSHEQFSLFHNKLFMNTLDSCYIVPKKRGALVKPQHLKDDIMHYVEEMDPDATFNSSIEQFLNLRQPSQSDGKTKEFTNSMEKKAAAKKPTSAKKRKNSSVTDDENKTSKSEYSPLSKSKIKNPAQPNENASASKIPVSSVRKTTTLMKSTAKTNKKLNEEKTKRQTTTPRREEEEKLIEENKDMVDEQPLEKTNDENFPRRISYTGTSEKFDLKTFISNNSANAVKKETRDTPQVPLPTAMEILQKTAQIVPKIPLAEQTQPKCISIPLVESNVKVSPEEVLISAVEDHSLSNEVKKVSLRETPLLKSNCLIRKGNEENTECTTRLFSKLSLSTTKTLTSSPPKNKTAIEVAIIQAFRNTDLQSSSSAETILKDVALNFKPLENDFRKDFEKYKEIVNEAIRAILFYIEKMESFFEVAYNISSAEFDTLQKQNHELALEKIQLAEFLKASVSMKIDEAKRIFQAHNNSNFSEKDTFMESAIEEIKTMYLSRMNLTSSKNDEGILMKRHEVIAQVIFQSLEKFCQVHKLTWSDILQENLQNEINKEFKNINKSLHKAMKKIDQEIDSCIAFYNNEMRRKLNYPLMNQTENFDELHTKTSSDAIHRFTNAIEKGNENFSNSLIQRDINEELESCCQKLRNEFAARKLQTSPLTDIKKIPTSSLTRVENNFFKPNKEMKCPTISTHAFSAKLEEKLSMPHNREAKNQIISTQPIHKSERPNRSIGIDLNVAEIIVSVFKDGAIEEILRRKDPCIGYNEEVIWVEGQSSTIWSLSSSKIYKTVSLRTILEAGVGEHLSLNWAGETKTLLFEELLSLMLSLVKFESEKLIGHEINICAISVPSYINETEVQAVHDAAKISSFSKSHVMRDICSAIFGCSYFKNMSGALPKNFILCNSFSENLDAGFYDLTKSWNPAVLSGDSYIHANQPNMLSRKPALKERFKNVLKDISGLVEDMEVTDVLVLANEKNYKDLSDQKHLKHWNFHKLQIPSIHNGAALVAALIGKNSDAEDYWKRNSPRELAGEKKLEEFLNHRWIASLTSQPFNSKKKGTNIPGCNICDHQEKLKLLLSKGLTEVV